jgi:4-amino-4-deoxy-L-arabinose transferase-like glycosyltransferase
MQALMKQLGRLSWVKWTFLGSLLLSAIAVAGAVTVGRDAAFYLDIAQRSLEHGPAIAFTTFNWPWFPLLLAGMHAVTGLSLETSAYLWCALCLAGTCALLVDVVRRYCADAAPWACLVVLSVPAFNAFRDDILREYGFWFFSALALWLALRWHERRSWMGAAAIQLVIGAAAIFRLEAILLVLVLNLCLLGELARRSGWAALIQLNALPLIGALAFGAVLVQQGEINQQRVEYFLRMLNPAVVHGQFLAMAQGMSEAILNKYSEDDAGTLLLSGMVAVIVLTFVKLCGPLGLPFLSRHAWSTIAVYWRRFRPFAIALLIYALVLLLLFINEHFINSRYASYLHLLAAPLLSLGLLAFARAYPRLVRAVVVLALLVMLDNVLSFGAKKTHYVEAGRWLSEHVVRTGEIYYDDSRMAYYAGWGYPPMAMPREQALSTEHAGEFRYFLLEAERGEPWLEDWLVREQRPVLSQFANRRGDTVLIIGERSRDSGAEVDAGEQ